MDKFFRIPFALSGDRATVPDSAAVDGSVSYIDGYGNDYQRPKSDPLSKNIEREKMNEILYDVTKAVAEIQGKGIADFVSTSLNGGSPYPYTAGAIVSYSGEAYYSMVGSNTSLPTDATKWFPMRAPVFNDITQSIKTGAVFHEYWNDSPGNGTVRAAVGMLGMPEANVSLNMDYTTGVHQYYDPAFAAMWVAVGPSMFAVQVAPAGIAGGTTGTDIWYASGAKYAFGAFPDGRAVINSDLSDSFGDTNLYIRRTTGKASIGGNTDLVLEGTKTAGVAGPILLNPYSTGDVFMVSGGGKISIGSLNSNNKLDVAVATSTGSSNVDGISINDGVAAGSGRAGLNFGVNVASSYGWMQFTKTTPQAMRINQQGGITYFGDDIAPLTDNNRNVGSSILRWSVIYAGTGTINTSDGREKQQVQDLTAQERAVALRIKGLIKTFRFNDAVTLKGAGARIHVGAVAQDVAAAFVAESLQPEDYALFCRDAWDEQPEIREESGEISTPYRAAGHRYGLRYEELLAFVIAAL